jgi:hypothetical protein
MKASANLLVKSHGINLILTFDVDGGLRDGEDHFSVCNP